MHRCLTQAPQQAGASQNIFFFRSKACNGESAADWGLILKFSQHSTIYSPSWSHFLQLILG